MPDRRNAFDAMRLVAALGVLYSHSFAMASLPEPTLFGSTVGTISVAVFFAASGYLVSQSWERSPRLVAFAQRRALRIFPGLVVAVLFTGLVVGPVATRLPALEYLKRPDTWIFLGSNAATVSGARFLPGVFQDLPRHEANGSLWTLRYEVLMYALLSLGACCIRLRWLCPLLLAVLLGIWTAAVGAGVVARNYPLPVLWRLGLDYDVVSLARLGSCFFAGACIRVLKVPLSRLAALALLGTLAALPRGGVAWALLLATAVPYAALVACLRPPRPMALSADLSYGIYVYAWPVQQLCAQGGLAWPALLLTSAAATLVLAASSWHWVERPALALKGRRNAAPPAGDAISERVGVRS